jgi:hypothetical protein
VLQPLTADQQAIAADPEYHQLAQRMARRFGQRYPVLADEYESEALVALCRAAQTFTGSDTTGFREYASAVIWADLIDLQRDWSPRGYRKSRESTAPRAFADERYRILTIPTSGSRWAPRSPPTRSRSAGRRSRTRRWSGSCGHCTLSRLSFCAPSTAAPAPRRVLRRHECSA